MRQAQLAIPLAEKREYEKKLWSGSVQASGSDSSTVLSCGNHVPGFLSEPFSGGLYSGGKCEVSGAGTFRHNE